MSSVSDIHQNFRFSLHLADLSLVAIPKDRYYPPASAPIFFGAALKDYLCLAKMQKGSLTVPQFKDHNIKFQEYDADHWLILSHAKDISVDLGRWLSGIASSL